MSISDVCVQVRDAALSWLALVGGALEAEGLSPRESANVRQIPISGLGIAVRNADKKGNPGFLFSAMLLVLFLLLPLVRSLQWCDKNYLSTDPIVPPTGQFPIPNTSSSSLLALRCSPAIKPFLASDASSPAAFIFDTPVTFSDIANANPITLSSNSSTPLSITVTVGSTTLAHGSVLLNATKASLPFSLTALQPSTTPYNVTCTASYAGNQVFTASSQLFYLPDPTSGSATKIDFRTGALWARRPNGTGDYQPVIPIGFYTQFDSYLASNLSMLDDLVQQGFTVVHPIPPYDDTVAMNAILDRMEQVGLYLMYDMRSDYQDINAVTSEVDAFHSRTSLLLWYTSDEPDGSNDPPSSGINAYNTITSLDPYHPISLVLNCQNFNFQLYALGADIILQDTYVIGVNATYSNSWGTPCTPDYGVCGCDNCKGVYEDITDRMDEFEDRLFIMGYERTKAVWTVPQAFIQTEYWSRYPTGLEFILQSVIAINHGALGVVSWKDPTTPEIKAFASLLAQSLPSITPFITHPNGTSSIYYNPSTRIDAGIWHIPALSSTGKPQGLVLASNLNSNTSISLDIQSIPGVQGVLVPGTVKQVLSGAGAVIDAAGKTVQLQGTGSVGFVFDLVPQADPNGNTTASSGGSQHSGAVARPGWRIGCLVFALCALLCLMS